MHEGVQAKRGRGSSSARSSATASATARSGAACTATEEPLRAHRPSAAARGVAAPWLAAEVALVVAESDGLGAAVRTLVPGTHRTAADVGSGLCARVGVGVQATTGTAVVVADSPEGFLAAKASASCFTVPDAPERSPGCGAASWAAGRSCAATMPTSPASLGTRWAIAPEAYAPGRACRGGLGGIGRRCARCEVAVTRCSSVSPLLAWEVGAYPPGASSLDGGLGLASP
mmetsp:Transcript_65433/g.181572  ORF Transcript_65433/g.181572 Transcript_65433/m.181572 type:complete len:230 (+) Transcript_65433:472-1161(+)